MKTLQHIFEPGTVGNIQLKNRLVALAVTTYCATEEGYVAARLIDLYEEQAKGGAGLITVQSANVTREAPGSRHQLGIYEDSYIPGLRELADRVHACGTHVALQLGHLGPGQLETMRKTGWDRELDCIGPSAIPFVNTGLIPREMSLKDIDYVENAFAEAARRARDAGFDAVEIHACHSRLINMFMSPFYNKRTDEYGGDRKKRARFACEIVERIKQRVGGDFPVIMKINADDFHDGGARIEDAVEYARLLAGAGADAICVSAGSFGFSAFCPTYMEPSGVWIPLAEEVKKASGLPVIAVGSMDLDVGEQALEEGRVDFVGLGRPLLADPHLPNKARDGRWEEIQYCTRCNNCLTTLQRTGKPTGEGIGCTVNPGLCHEKEFILRATTSPKKVMVVGGGLAGMEASCVLAERGHRVSLYEKEDNLGGQWNIALQQQQKKRLFSTLTEYLSRRLNKAGVEIALNKEVTPRLIGEIKPDVVVLATGATPLSLNVPGAQGGNVVQAIDVITGKAHAGDTVVVIGGRLRGIEMAVSLAEHGKKVSLVTKNRLGENGIPIEPSAHWTLRNKLIELGVHLYPNSPVREITGNGVYISYQGGVVFLKADTVVLAVGAKPEKGLRKHLEAANAGLIMYSIGDCTEPMDALQATQQGAEIGRLI